MASNWWQVLFFFFSWLLLLLILVVVFFYYFIVVSVTWLSNVNTSVPPLRDPDELLKPNVRDSSAPHTFVFLLSGLFLCCNCPSSQKSLPDRTGQRGEGHGSRSSSSRFHSGHSARSCLRPSCATSPRMLMWVQPHTSKCQNNAVVTQAEPFFTARTFPWRCNLCIPAAVAPARS